MSASFAYNDRQRQRDAEYSAAYAQWLRGLSPAERAKVEKLGLADAVDPNAIEKKHANIDALAGRIHDQATEKSDDFKLALSEAMAAFLHWVVFPHPRGGINPKAIAQRAIMAMWVLRPDIIGNLSLTEIGIIMSARPDVLSEQASKFSRRFGIRGRSQFSPHTREAQSRAKRGKRLTAPAVASQPKERLLFDLPDDPSMN